METLGNIILILFGLRVLHLLVMSYESVTEKKLSLSLTDAIAGDLMSWWDKRLVVIGYDYLEGNHKIYKWLITIIGGLVAIYYVFVGVIYVLTSAWFWWTVGGIVLTYCLILLGIHLHKKEKEKRVAEELAKIEAMNRACRELENKFKDFLGIPMTENAITGDNYEYCSGELERLLKMKTELEQTESEPDGKKKMDFINHKLLAFCRIPARSQMISTFGLEGEAVKEFDAEMDKIVQTGNYNEIREPKPDKQFIKEMNDNLVSYQEDLQDDRMEPILKCMNYVKGQDTTNWLGLTSTAKLSEQTSSLQSLYESAQDEFAELDEIRGKIMVYLSLARISAFENLYQGVELLNIIRDNAGGKNLTKQEDIVEFDLSSIQVVDAETGREVSLGSISSDAISRFFDKYENNERFARYVEENPKQAAATQLVSAGVSYLRQRMESIEKNNAIQEQIIEAIPQMVDAYTDGQANLLRAIEIIRALSEANRGFESIYAPLFNKVFVQGKSSSVTLEETQQLVLAVSEYNKISKSKL